MTGVRRDHVAEMQAQRQLQARVLSDPKATVAQFRVMVAVTDLVTSYSRRVECLMSTTPEN